MYVCYGRPTCKLKKRGVRNTKVKENGIDMIIRKAFFY